MAERGDAQNLTCIGPLTQRIWGRMDIWKGPRIDFECALNGSMDAPFDFRGWAQNGPLVDQLINRLVGGTSDQLQLFLQGCALCWV